MVLADVKILRRKRKENGNVLSILFGLPSSILAENDVQNEITKKIKETN